MNIIKPYWIPNHRRKKRIVVSTTPIETIGDNYPIIGAKTGSGDGYQTLVMVSEIGGIMVSGAIMNAPDEEARFDAMNELMLIGKGILINSRYADTFTVQNARNACLFAIDDEGTMRCIFAQNADEQSAPMSTSKVMSLSIIRDYIHDEMKEKYVYPSDVKDAGDDVVQEWDCLTIKDLIHAMMLESSNASANALARIVGYMILEKENTK